MRKVLVIGAGKVGKLVVRLLADAGDYHVVAADAAKDSAITATQTAAGAALPRTTPLALDVADARAVAAALHGCDYVVSCAPFHLNVGIATAAKACGVSYLDLTEDVATTKAIAQLAEGAKTSFVPQCGLAPGFISIVAADLAREFESLDSVRMRVGALPLYPNNRLKYNLTWSTEGLINEYGNPCEALVGGKIVSLRPLEGLESLSVDGIEYEAFNTSGGLGTLAETWAGRVRHLDYKTIRYPGHRDQMALLMNDLRFNDDRATLKRVLERSLAHTFQDVVLIFVTASGAIDGRYSQRSYVKKVYNAERDGERWSAIQITTASSLCAVLDLHAGGRLRASGFLRQEEIPLVDFLANRFGSAYA